MIVDVHAHHVPPAFLRRLERAGARWGVEASAMDGGAWRIAVGGRVARRPLLGGLLDMERRLAAMDEAAVDVQVLSCWATLVGYGVPAAHAAGYARAFNEDLAAAAASAPDRLRALAIVPLQAPDAAARELSHAVESLGMAGAEILTRVGEQDLDEPALDVFWERAEALGCLILVHPHDSLAGRRIERHRLENLVGNPAETTLALAHLVLGGVLERFPGLRLCAVHAGGYLPFAAGRLDRGHAALPVSGRRCRAPRASGCGRSTTTRSRTAMPRCGSCWTSPGGSGSCWAATSPSRWGIRRLSRPCAASPACRARSSTQCSAGRRGPCSRASR